MLGVSGLNRFQAFAVHLSISTVIVGLSAAIVFLAWYPGLLAYASGVGDIFLLLLLVDVALGPLITFIIFNPAKKELRRDLAVVGCIQIAALCYGLLTLFDARPVFIVFNNAQFDVVYANELNPEKLQKAVHAEFSVLPCWGPKVIGAQLPSDVNKSQEIILGAIAGGDDIQQMPEYYVPFAESTAAVIRAARPLYELKKYNKSELAAVDQLIGQYSAQNDEIGYIPLIGKLKKVSVLVDKKSASIKTMSKLKPLDESYGVDSINLKEVLKKTK